MYSIGLIDFLNNYGNSDNDLVCIDLHKEDCWFVIMNGEYDLDFAYINFHLNCYDLNAWRKIELRGIVYDIIFSYLHHWWY